MATFIVMLPSGWPIGAEDDDGEARTVVYDTMEEAVEKARTEALEWPGEIITICKAVGTVVAPIGDVEIVTDEDNQ